MDISLFVVARQVANPWVEVDGMLCVIPLWLNLVVNFHPSYDAPWELLKLFVDGHRSVPRAPWGSHLIVHRTERKFNYKKLSINEIPKLTTSRHSPISLTTELCSFHRCLSAASNVLCQSLRTRSEGGKTSVISSDVMALLCSSGTMNTLCRTFKIFTWFFSVSKSSGKEKKFVYKF